MKKLLLIAIACIGSAILSGCYKDDLKEFEEIDRIKLTESIAIPLIHQRLDTGFYNPLNQTIPFKFILADTISITLPEQDTSEFIIDLVTFRGLTENRYTGAAKFKMVFLDSLNVQRDVLPDNAGWTINGASSGQVAEDQFSISITRTRYEQLRQWKKIVLLLEVNSPTATGIPPGYTSLSFTYYIGIKIDGRTQFKF